MPIATIIPAMNGGELSRRMEGRVDLDGIYDRGAAEMVNFVPTVEGPLSKRPGFMLIREADTTAAWLSPFVPRQTQAYVVEWCNARLRFYTNGGRIETAGVPYEVATPYPASAAQKIWKHQSYDRLYLAHGDYPPATLDRVAAAQFQYQAFPFRRGPFKTPNSDPGVSVTASGTTGQVTLTATGPIFKQGHVGAPFYLEARDFSGVTAWEAGIDGVVVGAKRRSEGRVYEAASAGKTGTVQPTHATGTEYDGAAIGQDYNAKNAGGIRWTYIYDRFGEVTISAVAADGMSATAQVTRRLADTVQSAGTFRWAHCAFSAAEGWPNLVTVWAGRLWWFKGLEFYASVQNDFTNYAYYTDAGVLSPDMAFRRTLSSREPPIWIKADQRLLVGTPSGELLLGAINSQAAVSGDNVDALPQSNYGSADVVPVDIGTGLLFVQRGGRKIREAEYQFERDRFVGVNSTIYARHITRTGIRQLAYQQEPEETVWGVRGDGVFIAHPHSPEQQVKGYARVIMGAGGGLSCVAIPSVDGGTDELWVLGQLGAFRGVLRLADWWTEDDDAATDAEKLAHLANAFYVDWGVSYAGAARATFTTGLDHLKGRDVAVLANGGVVTGCKVDATGRLVPDLPYAATRVQIGIGYQARFRPMRMELRGQGGTSQGKRKRIVRMALRLIDTAAAIVVSGRGQRDRLIDRPTHATMDQPVPLFNGDTETKAVGGNYDRRAQPLILSDDPLPMMIAAVLPQVEIEQ